MSLFRVDFAPAEGSMWTLVRANSMEEALSIAGTSAAEFLGVVTTEEYMAEGMFTAREATEMDQAVNKLPILSEDQFEVIREFDLPDSAFLVV